MQKYTLSLYGLYVIGTFMQFSVPLAIPGLVLFTVAYFMNLSGKKRAAGTPYESHMRWLLRTFYIGTCLLLPISAIIAQVVLLSTTDISGYTAALDTGDPAVISAMMSAYLEANATQATIIFTAFLAPVTLWMLWRWWKGGTLAQNAKPVENVTAWI